MRPRSVNMPFLRGFAGVAGLLLMGGGVLEAQETPAPKPAESSAQTALASPIAVTLKRAIELALLNSKEIQVAKIQASVADHAAQITKAQFMPNLYAGSGAGYINGIKVRHELRLGDLRRVVRDACLNLDRKSTRLNS